MSLASGQTDEFRFKQKRMKLDPIDKRSSNYDEKIFKNELILNYIFRNLTARQCGSVSRVSKSFNRICSKIIKQYSKIEDLFLIYGLTNYMKKNHLRYSKLIRAKSVENYDNLKEEILNSIKNQIQIIPSIAIFFNSFRSSTLKHYSAFINSNKFISSLPKSCSILNFSCCHTGVIGNLPDCSVETLQDSKFISGISYFFLPDFNSNDCQIIPFNGSQSELCKYLSEEKILNSNIKGLITIIKFDPLRSPDFSILGKHLHEQDVKIALGGIIVEHIDISSNIGSKQKNLYESKSMIKTDFSSLIFSGDNVNCASLIINGSDEKEIAERILEFKNGLHFDYNQPNSEFFGFLFACAGRGYNLFNKLNLESDLVREQFPNLKLCGIFGLGEVGLNFYADYRTNRSKKEEVLHYYSTVLFIVHIIKSR